MFEVMKIPFHWYAWCAAEDWQHCHSGIQSNVSTLVLIRVLFFLTSFLYINDISLNRPCIIYIHNNRKKMFFSLIEPPRLSLMFTFFMFFWSNYRVMMTEIWSIMQMRSHQRWTSTVCSSPSTDLTPPALVWIHLSLSLSPNRPVTILQATI